MRIVKKYKSEGAVWMINADHCTPLMLLDGFRYVSIDDDADVSENVGVELEDVDLSDADLLHALRSKSEVCDIRNRHTQELIAAKYSTIDELQAIRENDQTYLDFVSGVVTEGSAFKDELGLIA